MSGLLSLEVEPVHGKPNSYTLLRWSYWHSSEREVMALGQDALSQSARRLTPRRFLRLLHEILNEREVLLARG
jgi:hypothetical protein